jgi:hypothetical protein
MFDYILVNILDINFLVVLQQIKQVFHAFTAILKQISHPSDAQKILVEVKYSSEVKYNKLLRLFLQQMPLLSG